MVSLIAPKKHGVFGDLFQQSRINPAGVRQNRFQQMFFSQAINRILVISYRVDGDGGPRKPIGVHLPVRRNIFEAFSAQLDKARVAHATHKTRGLALFARAWSGSLDWKWFVKHAQSEAKN